MDAESLDIERPGALVGYLERTGRLGGGTEPRVRVLAGGVSNRTVLVEWPETSEAWVLKQALPKLRVAVDWFSDPGRIHQEALGLRWLERLAPSGTTTPLVFEDYENHLLAMKAVPEPHENWKTMLLRGELDTDHVEQFGRLLGVVHRGGYERREEMARIFENRTIFESLRLEPYYGYAAEQVPAATRFLNALIEETLTYRLTLVHGDYSPKNCLVREGQIVLLDHEVIHFGEPAFDLGFSLTHFLSKANHLPEKRSAFSEAARLHWSVYRDEIEDLPWMEGLERRAVRHTIGCLLARVAGRSPLEYLDDGELARQKEAVLALIQDPPESVPGLVEGFVGRL
ncbi:MAG: phosphotransferase [Actinomycetota bacterium]|nr:phosphotransferase [Actinomycetota bacterium]